MLCFRKFPVVKKMIDKREGGEYQNFPSIVFFHSAEKFRRRTL